MTIATLQGRNFYLYDRTQKWRGTTDLRIGKLVATNVIKNKR